mgnify:FL=1
MRVSTGKSSGSDDRLFTVVVEGYGVGRQRAAEQRFTVPFAKLQSLMQSIARNGGKIRIVIGDDVPEVLSQLQEATPAPQAAPIPSQPPTATKTPAAVKIGRAHV